MAAVEIMDTVEEDGIRRLEEVVERIVEMQDVHRIMKDLAEQSRQSLLDEDLSPDERTHHERMRQFAEQRLKEIGERLGTLIDKRSKLELVMESEKDVYSRIEETNSSISAVELRVQMYEKMLEKEFLTENERDLYSSLIINREDELAHLQSILHLLEIERNAFEDVQNVD